MTTNILFPRQLLMALTLGLAAPFAAAGVSAEEAQKLKTVLTPMGAERAGNTDGSIPAWNGGLTQAAGAVVGNSRPDPFTDKPLYTITAKNAAEYQDKLSDGVRELLKRDPDTFRLDVYKSQRTAAAPDWVYDNTAKNAARATLEEGAAGPVPKGAHAGVPFPIPKSGAEVMWNHLLRWRGLAARYNTSGTMGTADGKLVSTVEGQAQIQMPYYDQTADAAMQQAGEYWLFKMVNVGPPIRAGEAIVGRLNLDSSKDQSWVYLTGQRRTRKLPNACCDTPNQATAGIMSFDDIEVFTGRLDTFDWKLVGKKELLVPYNSNRTLQPKKNAEVLMPRHINPDHVRWELHRVWVVEATLKPGKRHPAARSRYYIDEDSWMALLGDRWDANGQLWKTNWEIPAAMPDVPAQSVIAFGFHDFVSRVWFVNLMRGENSDVHYKVVPRFADSTFTPDALAGEGVR
ncbi:DUF1329 domain-containing protein [Variovorax sp. Sphag1AA]|uniref:DUF1329 domain-containing protein n=1 Tax=Variovorax sp. Sphag1AA TaxID=2587027 RepID=UPI001613D7DA|nr:DUF1329 domain-containing protein [Variovorax sp. Sphag1AA]MBB3177998.1 hypothetical protein [Variovorax sp. Sphag1AA]